MLACGRILKLLVVDPKKRMARWPKHIMGAKTYIGKDTALGVMLGEACVCKHDAPMYDRFRLWPLRRDDSSCVLIGASGMRRSDWRRRNVGALIGQSACRLLTFA